MRSGVYRRAVINLRILALLGLMCWGVAEGVAQDFANLDFEQAGEREEVARYWQLNQKSTRGSLDAGEGGKAMKLQTSENWRKNFYQDQKISP